MMKYKIQRGAFKIAVIFLTFALLGVTIIDKIIDQFVLDVHQNAAIHLYAVWGFVFLSAIVIFILISREISGKIDVINSVKVRNEYQRLLIQNLPDTDIFLVNTNLELLFHEQEKTESHFKKVLQLELKSRDNFCSKATNALTLHKTLSKVKKGERINLAVDTEKGFLEIYGIPIFNDQKMVEAILLIILNRTAQRELIQQISSEKQSYADLSERYHSLNQQLEESYAQMKINNNELLENKERYGAFIQQTSEAVYRFDLKKAIDQSLPTDTQVAGILSSAYLAEYNSAFAEFYNLNSSDNYIGKFEHEIFNRRNQTQYVELMHMLVQHDYQLKDFETIEYDGQGRSRYFLNNVVGILEENKLIRFWGTKHETTKQKKYERELIQSKKTAEQSNRLKTAFLANMSHEIRTPLNGILGFSELLVKPGIQEDKKTKYYHIIQSSSQQLLRIINDILDISRIQTGELSITKIEFGVNTLLNEIEAALLHDIEQKKEKVSFEIKTTLEQGVDRIFTDRDRLYQIVSNLANNALKFTHQGKIIITYEAKSDSIMEFSVSDTGIGIPDQYLGDIFDQFRQVEEFSSRKYGGTGLGLSICKGLSQLLGGYIAVESEDGVGSTFRFTIKTK